MRVFLGSIWLAGPGVPLAFPVTARKVDAASQTAEVLGFGQAIPIADLNTHLWGESTHPAGLDSRKEEKPQADICAQGELGAGGVHEVPLNDGCVGVHSWRRLAGRKQ
eukprot:scaffold96417_cov32-Tisochrysis_lutea.AAC.2